MNNRLNSLFKKIGYRNKSSYVLELFGFDALSNTKTNQNVINETIKESVYETEQIFIPNVKTDENIIELQTQPFVQQTNSAFITNYKTEELTDEFTPTNITEQFKSIWINLEQRRKWIYPAFFIMFTSILTLYVISSYISTQTNSDQTTQEFIELSDSINNLYYSLEEIILISTDSFFSKYDISNASADLQAVEAQLIAYENIYRTINYDFENISRYNSLGELENNLNNYLLLINKLDILITYRILITEILIYPELPVEADAERINILTTDLSNISANSISNYEQLPNITIFSQHNERLKQSIEVANELHGQYLAALRNKENETATSLILSIDLNNEFIKQSYEKSLIEFRDDATKLYTSLIPFP